MCARFAAASTLARRKFHSPRINLATWLARVDGDDDGRLFDRERFERLVESPVELFGIDLLRALERRADKQDDLALGRRLRRERFGKLRATCRAARFKDLRQFPRQRRLAGGRELRRGPSVSRRHGAAIRKRQALPGIAASAAIRSRRAADFGGRKPSKKKRSVGRPATTSAVRTAEGAGDRGDRQALRQRGSDELVAGVGNQRRAGVGDECERCAIGEPGE